MKKLFSALVLLGIALQTTCAASFSDVPLNNKFYAPVAYLSAKKIIQGYEDGTYKPGDTITRAAMLKILLEASDFEIPESLPNIFSDVPADFWFAKYVNFSANKGFIDKGEKFYPERNVNRAEFFKMLCNIFEIKPENYTLNVKSIDVPEGFWFEPYINFAVKFGILEQEGAGKVYPDRSLTRGEAADFLFKTLQRGRGLSPQILLNLTEDHLAKTLTSLEGANSVQATMLVSVAEKFSNTTLEFLPNNETVLIAAKIVEALKNLVEAYTAGEAKRYDDVITSSKKAWATADEIKQEEYLTLVEKIKLLAENFANKARSMK